MSERFPPLELTSDLGRGLEDEFKKHYGSNPNFKWKNDKGEPIGPFAVLAYTPDLFRPWMMLGDAILHQRTIDPRSRELICLAVTAVFEVPYIRYAHERIGMAVGLSQEQVSSAVKGIVPKDLVESDTVIYKTALKLAQSRGSLDNEIWREVEVKLGRERAARVGHIVAWFIYNCTLLNLGAVDVPLD